MRFTFGAGMMLAAGMAAVWVSGCGSGNGVPATGGGALVPVRAVAVAAGAVPLQVRTFGTVEADAAVDLKPQVAGLLAEECVQPGQTVKKDDMLFRIDARPYAAVARQSEASLARNRILSADARRRAEKADRLFQTGVGSEDDMKSARALADALDAAVAADSAQLDQARLNLEYCDIRAPFAGRIGELKVRRGGVVKINETVLTTLAQTKPVHVAFAVPQTGLPEVRAEMAKHSLAVEVALRDQGASLDRGVLDFVDNTVEADTGTIKLKAVFPNATEVLWPGQFVSVVLTLREDAQALSIPGAAVQNGQKGTYVYVVKAQRVLEPRVVLTGKTFDGLVTVEEGLYAGATVMVGGKEAGVVSRPPEKPGTGWFSRLLAWFKPPRQKPYLLVPEAAVHPGTDKNAGKPVVIVAELAVELRPVTVARAAGDRVVIADGVQAGELVVTDGQIRLLPGAKVTLLKGKE